MTDRETQGAQLNRAAETALVMVDALLDPEDALVALIYLQGFFYGKAGPGDTKSLVAARELAEIVLENIKSSTLVEEPSEFVRQRLLTLLTSIQLVLKRPEWFVAEKLKEQLRDDGVNNFPMHFRPFLGPSGKQIAEDLKAAMEKKSRET